jgi:hypothetical protein
MVSKIHTKRDVFLSAELIISFVLLVLIGFSIDFVLSIILSAIILIRVFIIFFITPNEILFKDNFLVLKRPFDEKIFELNSIESISKIQFQKLRKVYALEGVMGFYGIYLELPYQAQVKMMALKNSNLCQIRFINDYPIIVSVEDLNDFQYKFFIHLTTEKYAT